MSIASPSSLQPGDVVAILSNRKGREFVVKTAPIERVTPRRIVVAGNVFDRETGRSTGPDKCLCYTLTADRAVIDAHLAEMADRQAVKEAEAQTRAELEATPRWKAADAIANAIMPFTTADIHDRYTESQLVRIVAILNEPQPARP